MHAVITGAGGFVGAALASRLRAQPQALAPDGGLRLTLVDRAAPLGGVAANERWHVDGFADAALLQSFHGDPPDCVFHLASVPGALAEREPAVGLQANLLDTVALLEGLAVAVRQGQASTPRVVFASSVAVYGALGAVPVTPAQAPQPTLSYGAHKLMTEYLLADYSRRGELDGCSLRLPGVVARPPAETGHGSAFMSQIFHASRAGHPYTCPVSPEATAWWMSLDRCLDNLLHAATLATDAMPASRCWQPPVLHASLAEVVDAIAVHMGRDAQACLRFAPDPRIEALFGRLPALDASPAQAAGFAHDGTVQDLVARVLAQVRSMGTPMAALAA